MKALTIIFSIFLVLSFLQYPISATSKKPWTILFYGITEGDIEEGVVDDLIELESVGTNSNMNILFEMDFSNKSLSNKRRLLGSSTFSNVMRSVVKKGYATRTDLGEKNIGDPKLLYDFLKWGITNYPAEKYAFIIHGHSSGVESYYGPGSAYYNPARAVGYDDVELDCLTMEELSNTFTKVQKEILNNNKLDVIGFASCETAQIENLYRFKDNFKYFVGSETTMMSGITNFEDFVIDVNSNPWMSAKTFSKKLSERMIASGSFWGSIDVMKQGAISASFDLSKVGDVLLKTRELSTALLKVPHSKLSFTDLILLDEKYKRYLDFKKTLLSIYEGNVGFTNDPNYKKIKNLAALTYNSMAKATVSLWTAGKWNHKKVSGVGIYWPEEKTRYEKFKSFYRRVNFAYLSKWWEFLNYKILNDRSTIDERLETLKFINSLDMNDDQVYELRENLISDIQSDLDNNSENRSTLDSFINKLNNKDKIGFNEFLK